MLARFAACFVLLTTWSVPAASEDWAVARTDNFTIYSTGDAEDLRRRALRLEWFDALLRLRYRIPGDPSPNPLTLYLLDGTRDVGKSIGARNSSVAGYYSDDIDGSYAVSHRTRGRPGDLTAEAVLFHEYAHHFMYRYFPFAYPGWYREGFAEYWATVTFDDDGNWTYGRPPVWRRNSLSSAARQVPVERMLLMKQSDMQPQEAYQVYTRGWLMVHMMHSDRERAQQLDQFIRAVADGTNKREAAESAFGDLDDLDRDLRRYLGESPRVIGGREPLQYSGRMEIEDLGEVESEIVGLAFANARGIEREKARDRLARLAAANPDNAVAWTELADAEHMIAHVDASKREEDEDIDDVQPALGAAIVAIDRAIAADPEYSRAHAHKAEFLVDLIATSDTPDAGMIAQARDHAMQANRLQPDDPLPLMLFYQTFEEAKEPPSDIARSAIARAFELAPEVVTLRTRYALDLARHGEFDRAEAVVSFLLADPHDYRRGQVVMKQIELLRAGQDISDLDIDELLDEEDEDDD